MNPNADVTYQTVNLFSSDKYFICFISDCPHLMKFVISTSCPHLMKFRNQHNNVCTILVKIDVLDTCGAMICSNLESYLCYFLRRKRMLYTSFQNSMFLFINGLLFDIINIQNNQFLEFK